MRFPWIGRRFAASGDPRALWPRHASVRGPRPAPLPRAIRGADHGHRRGAATCHCGAIQWQLDGDPCSITAYNGTVFRRYGAPWAYDREGERIRLAGPAAVQTLKELADPFLGFHFCPTCACVVAWRAMRPEEDSRRRMAADVRLAPPEAVADLLIDRFDGLDSFHDLPQDGNCVRDMWF